MTFIKNITIEERGGILKSGYSSKASSIDLTI